MSNNKEIGKQCLHIRYSDFFSLSKSKVAKTNKKIIFTRITAYNMFVGDFWDIVLQSEPSK